MKIRNPKPSTRIKFHLEVEKEKGLQLVTSNLQPMNPELNKWKLVKLVREWKIEQWTQARLSQRRRVHDNPCSLFCSFVGSALCGLWIWVCKRQSSSTILTAISFQSDSHGAPMSSLWDLWFECANMNRVFKVQVFFRSEVQDILIFSDVFLLELFGLLIGYFLGRVDTFKLTKNDKY